MDIETNYSFLEIKSRQGVAQSEITCKLHVTKKKHYPVN